MTRVAGRNPRSIGCVKVTPRYNIYLLLLHNMLFYFIYVKIIVCGNDNVW